MQVARTIDTTAGLLLGVGAAAAALWLGGGWAFDHWATR